MINSSSRWDMAVLLALLLAWISVWGAWIPHPTTALTQNAVGLADWSPFLNDVRYGDLRLMPDLLRLAVALSAVALVFAAGAIQTLWARWSVRLLAVLSGLVLLPPYPFVLNPFATGYGLRFGIVVGLWGVIAATVFADRLPEQARRILVAVFSLSGVMTGGWAYSRLLSPFEAHYAHSLNAGWGVLVFGIASLVAVGIDVFGIVNHLRQPVSP